MSFVIVVLILLGHNVVGNAVSQTTYPSLMRCEEQVEKAVEEIKEIVQRDHPNLPIDKMTFQGSCKLKGGETDG